MTFETRDAFWNGILTRFGKMQRAQKPQEAKHKLLGDVKRRLSDFPDEDERFRTALRRADGKYLVAWFFTCLEWLPQSLYAPMIEAAVEELDPSRNRLFVNACVAAFGHRRVNQSLLDVLEHGNNFEKAGAANALYWAQVPLVFEKGVSSYEKAFATPESRTAFDAIADLRQRRDVSTLREFVDNDDLDVRRAMIPCLVLDADHYDDDTKPLVHDAIRIAREHKDEYIRHRVEVQLGNAFVYRVKPDRTRRQE